ncbi:MAG: sulfur carrier protein ThiS [Pseudomonadota bacterium]|nr:sulfur carrier protein ThiS [Pseudomonadota bacterium]
MQITVNGEPRTLTQALNLVELLELLHLGERRVAIQLNGDIVPRTRHAATTVADGDELLIVQAIGGG